MTRCLQGQRSIQVDELADLHHAGDLKRIALAAFTKYLLEYLVDGNDRHQKVLGVFNGGCK